MFWTDIARFLQYFRKCFINIFAILQDFNGIFSKYSFNITVLSGLTSPWPSKLPLPYSVFSQCFLQIELFNLFYRSSFFLILSVSFQPDTMSQPGEDWPVFKGWDEGSLAGLNHRAPAYSWALSAQGSNQYTGALSALSVYARPLYFHLLCAHMRVCWNAVYMCMREVAHTFNNTLLTNKK